MWRPVGHGLRCSDYRSNTKVQLGDESKSRQKIMIVECIRDL